MIEHGYYCTLAVPNVCTPLCGDNLIANIEGCDDGDALPLDGCDGSCAIETGF